IRLACSRLWRKRRRSVATEGCVAERVSKGGQVDASRRKRFSMPSLWTFRKRRADTPSSEQEKRDSSRRTPTRRLSKRRKPNRTPTPPHRIVSENPPYLPTPPTSSHGDAIEIIPQLDSSSERSRSREIVEDQAVTPP